jgi:hypothetical protein
MERVTSIKAASNCATILPSLPLADIWQSLIMRRKFLLLARWRERLGKLQRLCRQNGD